MSGWTKIGLNIWAKTGVTIEPNMVFFNGKKGSKKIGILACTSENDWYWDYNNLYIYSTLDPNSAFTRPGIEATRRDYCISNTGTAEYIIISNLSLKHAGSAAIAVNLCNEWIIHDCTFSDNLQHILVEGNITKTGWEIYNNIFGNISRSPKDHWDDASVRLRSTSGAKVYNNYFQPNNVVAIKLGRDSAPSYDNEIYLNEFTHCNSVIGIGESTGVKIYRNHLYDCRGYAIAIQYGSDNAEIYYNLIHDFSGPSLETGSNYNGIDINTNSNNGKCYNNIVRTVVCACLYVGATSPGSADGWVIKNNILDATNNENCDGPIQIDTISSITLSNNLYYPGPNNTVGRLRLVYYDNISSWETAVNSLDNHSEQNSISSDPLFFDAYNDDYTLQSISQLL